MACPRWFGKRMMKIYKNAKDIHEQSEKINVEWKAIQSLRAECMGVQNIQSILITKNRKYLEQAEDDESSMDEQRIFHVYCGNVTIFHLGESKRLKEGTVAYLSLPNKDLYIAGRKILGRSWDRTKYGHYMDVTTRSQWISTIVQFQASE